MECHGALELLLTQTDKYMLADLKMELEMDMEF